MKRFATTTVAVVFALLFAGVLLVFRGQRAVAFAEPLLLPRLTVAPPSLQDLFTEWIYLPLVTKGARYDRAAAVAHADQFAHARSSDYPDYGSGCICNDCTNFVSQALHKGGLQLKTGQWEKDDVFEWWYKKTLFWYENSKTWSATDWFNTYLFQYPNEFEVRDWPTQLEAGDFFILDLHGKTDDDPPDGIPDHARFVVGEGVSSVDPAEYTCTDTPIPPATEGLLVSQHCTDRKRVLWDFNLKNFGVWSFHVITNP